MSDPYVLALEARVKEMEAELAGHKARLAAINIYGDADIAAFKWQARAEAAEAKLADAKEFYAMIRSWHLEPSDGTFRTLVVGNLNRIEARRAAKEGGT